MNRTEFANLWLLWFQLADATATVNTSPAKPSAVAVAKISTPSATAPEEVKDMKVQLSQTGAEVKGERSSQVRELGQDSGQVYHWVGLGGWLYTSYI